MNESEKKFLGVGWSGGEPSHVFYRSLDDAHNNAKWDFEGDSWTVYEIKAVKRGKKRTLQEIAIEAVAQHLPGQLIPAIKWTREQFSIDHCGEYCGLRESKDAVEDAIKAAAISEWRSGFSPRRVISAGASR